MSVERGPLIRQFYDLAQLVQLIFSGVFRRPPLGILQKPAVPPEVPTQQPFRREESQPSAQRGPKQGHGLIPKVLSCYRFFHLRQFCHTAFQEHAEVACSST